MYSSSFDFKLYLLTQTNTFQAEHQTESKHRDSTTDCRSLDTQIDTYQSDQGKYCHFTLFAVRPKPYKRHFHFQTTHAL